MAGDPAIRLHREGGYGGSHLNVIAAADASRAIATAAETRNDAALPPNALAARLKRSDSFEWETKAGERQLKVLEFVEIAYVLRVESDIPTG